MPKGTPTETVLGFLKEGRSKQQIMQELQGKGYGLQQINEALNQASIKMGVEGDNVPRIGGNMANEDYQPSEEMRISELEKETEIPVPAPEQNAGYAEQAQDYGSMPSPQEMADAAAQQAMPQGYGLSQDDVQSLVEEIIDEKWRELMSSVGDIATWKVQMADETEAIKQEILRIQARFDNLQAAVLGKVDEYSRGITDVGTEMKALEKVFEKILEPMSANIKELARITEDLRTSTSKKK
ncbi:MAG: hypothetical protein V1906_03820 [Candidatus Woesearchaeota archaeon]